MKIHKPRLRVGKRGLSAQNVGVRLGGKKGGVNVSRTGVSGSVKVGRGTYNTKRGCLLPFFALALLPCAAYALLNAI